MRPLGVSDISWIFFPNLLRFPFVFPHDLVLKVEKAISTCDMGYRNRSEFIIEAVREKVQQIMKKEVPA